MTRRFPHPWPLDHPEIVAIALDVMLVPARRAHYSPLVLMLADAAIERIRRELAESTLVQPPEHAAQPEEESAQPPEAPKAPPDKPGPS
jgi:hypothetical protein